MAFGKAHTALPSEQPGPTLRWIPRPDSHALGARTGLSWLLRLTDHSTLAVQQALQTLFCTVSLPCWPAQLCFSVIYIVRILYLQLHIEPLS